MKTITPTALNLSDEQQSAFDAMLDRHNAALEQPITSEDYCADILIGTINSEVASRYKEAVQYLGDSSASAPFDHRQKMIAINAALASIPDNERQEKLASIIAIIQ